MNFFGIEGEPIDYSHSEVVFVPVPFDGTSTWGKGADKAPQAILEASEKVELYDIETKSSVYEKGFFTVPPVCTGDEKSEDVADLVQEAITKIVDDKKFPVMIGGEHSVSIGAFRAMASRYEDFSILQFDAHSDMRDEYYDSKYNHGCVMARGKEVCNHITQVGIRSMGEEELVNINQDRVFYAFDINSGRLGNWIEKVISQLTDNVYITIDVDAMDPAYFPATGTPEPEGIRYRDILDTIKAVAQTKNIIGLDVVELAPTDDSKPSDFTAAKLIYQILSYKYFYQH